MRIHPFAYLTLAALAAFGCGWGGPKDADQALKDKSVVDVLKDAAEDEYDAPEDGKLTDAQIQMYLKVKERERDLLKAAKSNFQEQKEKVEAAEKKGSSLTAAWEGFKALKSAGDLLTLDIRAAQELKYNTAEYQWVKGQVLGAAVSTYTDNLKASSVQAWEQSLEQLKQARQSATDESTRKIYDEQIANLEQLIAESKSEEEGDAEQAATRYNQKLLEKYGDQIKLLEAEIQKYSGLEGN